MSAIDELALVGHMRDKANVGKMTGDYLREASVLVLVFGFLEPFVGATREVPDDRLVLFLALSVSLFLIGVVLERIS